MCGSCIGRFYSSLIKSLNVRSCLMDLALVICHDFPLLMFSLFEWFILFLGKSRVNKASYDLKVKERLLESAFSTIVHILYLTDSGWLKFFLFGIAIHDFLQVIYLYKYYHSSIEPFLFQLESNRVELLEKLYPNLVYTQSLGHVSFSLYILNLF